MDQEQTISTKKLMMEKLHLICILVANQTLMVRAVSEDAYSRVSLGKVYQTEWGKYYVWVKYPKWLDLEDVRTKCYDYLSSMTLADIL